MTFWDFFRDRPMPMEDEVEDGKTMTDIVQDLPDGDHKHEWQFITKTYGAPRKNIEGQGTIAYEKALFGVTTFLWECLVCKALRKQELLGSEGSQLDDILQKAESFGPQYIQREGVTYAIAKMQPQAQTPGIPVR